MIFDRNSLAQELKLSVETIDRNKKSGKLPCRKIGKRILFTETDVKTFLDACACTPSTACSLNTLNRKQQPEVYDENSSKVFKKI